MQTKHHEMKRLNQQMKDIRGLADDFMNEVKIQENTLTQVDTHMTQANEQVEEAKKQLSEALDKQR